MKRTLIFLMCMLICTFAYAVPSRQYTYSAGNTIKSSEVTANEDEIYNYLAAGVDTIKDGSIVNADVNASAAIQSTKLSLASIAQDVAMDGATFRIAKGADVASTASMTLGTDGNYFDITGTTGITSITAKSAGFIAVLQFDGSLTVTDGSNLKIAGDFNATADDILILISDGTNWREISRSAN